MPGCIAGGVSCRRGGSNGGRYLTIKQLTITSNYAGMLANHISTIKAAGFA